MRAAIYARVSTDDQAKEGYSIAAQLKRLNAYCKARGWLVAGEYVDEGHSGRSTHRPAYQRAMMEKDSWDVLVVLKMDRIHRNSQNFTVMMNALKEWGKEFNSMQESFDTTTAIGRFVMDTIQRIAQLESEQIGERVKVGMSQKAKKGKGPLGSGIPYGYQYQYHKLVIVPEEADVIRTIFDRCLAFETLQQIADSLNAAEIKTKKGLNWERSTVRNVLTDPLSIGVISWDGIEQRDPHLAIIDQSVFQEAQKLLASRNRGSTGRRSRTMKHIDGGMVHA